MKIYDTKINETSVTEKTDVSAITNSIFNEELLETLYKIIIHTNILDNAVGKNTYYYSLESLGIDHNTETFENFFKALPAYSSLQLVITEENAKIYPYKYGKLYIYYSGNINRSLILFYNDVMTYVGRYTSYNKTITWTPLYSNNIKTYLNQTGVVNQPINSKINTDNLVIFKSENVVTFTGFILTTSNISNETIMSNIPKEFRGSLYTYGITNEGSIVDLFLNNDKLNVRNTVGNDKKIYVNFSFLCTPLIFSGV